MIGIELTATYFVDTHAHLDDEGFDGDRSAVISRARARGVRQIINVGYQPDRWRTTIALRERDPIFAIMLGIHPQHAQEANPGTLQELRNLLITEQAVALGEIGLDYSRSPVDIERQESTLVAQLELARSLNLPIVIHQRAAETDLITVLDRFLQLPPLVLHSFDGTSQLADYAIKRNFLVGIGGLATRQKSAALREVLSRLPPDRLLLETDSPYLAPAGSAQRRNEPMQIPAIAAALSPLWCLSPEELGATTTRTAIATFGLPLVGGDEIATPSP
ncbi:MAG: TatD family hydrolase [Chloroflexota bacterium]|nr:TatD family hydrolase [Chloroflexota bacterium]